MPFHSVMLDWQARLLLEEWCLIRWFDEDGSYTPRYVVNRDWEDGDIMAAMRSARIQLNLTPETD